MLPSIAAERARRHQRNLRSEAGVTQLAERFAERHGPTVLGGPFRGMRYALPFEDVDAPVAKLLGAYELELHEALERVIGAEPQRIVNIGCADGYYAVGLALRLPAAVVAAYDLARSARQATENLALENGVARRVEVRRRCETFDDASFVLCDIEGAELVLLDRTTVQHLANCRLLVELHSRDIADELLRRFERTHRAEPIAQTPREPADYPELAAFTERDARLALSEMRPDENSWALFDPRRLCVA